jgi:hypothetical protein
VWQPLQARLLYIVPVPTALWSYVATWPLGCVAGDPGVEGKLLPLLGTDVLCPQGQCRQCMWLSCFVLVAAAPG